MQFKPLSEQLSVAAQLQPADLVAARDAGFTWLVNNRPDGEESGQPASADLAALAQALGLHYRHIPVVGGAIRPDDIAAFDAVLQDADGPVLAFCRSGNRSTTLWALTRRGRLPVEQILRTAAAAGYDLRARASELDAHAHNTPECCAPPPPVSKS